MGRDPTPLRMQSVLTVKLHRLSVRQHGLSQLSGDRRERQGQIMSESGGRAVVIAPSALGWKDLPAVLSKIPWRQSAGRYIRRRGTIGGMWRRRIRGEVPDMTISRVPRAWLPETKSGRRNELRHFP